MSPGSYQPGPNLEQVPRFILDLEPWAWTFGRNLFDTLFFRSPRPDKTIAPAPFWSDVFISQRMPLAAMRQSLLYHIFVVVSVWGLTITWAGRPRIVPEPFTKNRSITYYQVSEYLPAISSPSAPAPVARKGEPEYARQPIISMPELPDNTTQTIVDPNSVEVLPQQAKLPNLVAWTQIPAAPIAAGTHSASQLTLPWQVPAPVVPAAQNTDRKLSELAPNAPTPSAVQPPLSEEVLKRKIGELNIAQSPPLVEAPKVAVPAQEATGTDGNPAASVQAAPSVQGVTGTAAQASGQLIALNLHPGPPPETIQPPGGNRRGVFAATPEGRPGAPGTPDIAAGGNGAGGTGASGPGSSGNIPAGIYVGGPATASPVAVVGKPPVSPDAQKKALMAAMARSGLPGAARALHVTTPVPNRPEGGKIEDQVFGPKKYYSMILNMPNLTSGGGSWIVRFAELHASSDAADLTAPVAVQKVDPAYPAELIRARVEGTVVLYAVIHTDGTVSEVRVLRSVDGRLDENARQALSRWHFRPATKLGAAVDLETVVHIPFTLPKTDF